MPTRHFGRNHVFFRHEESHLWIAGTTRVTMAPLWERIDWSHQQFSRDEGTDAQRWSTERDPSP
jgi:hypothetical protein